MMLFLISCTTSGPDLHLKSSKTISRFHTAATRNDLETVKKLVSDGQYINERSIKNGNTALENAAIKDSFDVAEYLLNNGAETELGDHNGLKTNACSSLLERNRYHKFTDKIWGKS